VQQFVNSRWWEGPSWLRQSEDEWPSEEFQIDEEEVDAEKRKTTITQVSLVGEQTPWYMHRFSSYHSNIRVVAWIRRFIAKSRKLTQEDSELTTEEIEAAEKHLFRIIQQESFSSTESQVCGLKVGRMEDGLIYVNSKLLHRQDSEEFRKPILLPNKHPLVDQLIREEHLRNGHAGVQYLMAKIREKCWIVQGRKAIRKIVKTCVRCRRFCTKKVSVTPAPLPEDRVKSSKVFEVTGVDLAGPLFLKNGGKAWVVLFTCAVFRGVHLELVTSLETDSFLLAFLRFVSRRGRPAIVYSDNGTNFVGAANLFKNLDWKRIQREANVQRIQWKFNPPTAAWWGGWWERLIQTMKSLLRRMLGHSKLNYIQLETCLCEVEAVMNNRPLTYVTEDQEDLVPLTPAMFMQDQEVTKFPEIEELTAGGFRKKFKVLQQLKRELCQRFRSEYLGILVHRGKNKKTTDFKVGDVILVGCDNLKRLDWPMARITELLPGKDGNTRVARVKTASGFLTRPLQRLYPLEVSAQELTEQRRPESRVIDKRDTVDGGHEDSPGQSTRCGRRVRRPVRFGL
jgi:hypothetical protein